MKVTIDMELTPQEARDLLGLPDVTPMQERLLAQLEKQLAANLAYVDPEMIMKAVTPMGMQGLERLQGLLMDVAGSALSGGGAKGEGVKKAKRPAQKTRRKAD